MAHPLRFFAKGAGFRSALIRNDSQIPDTGSLGEPSCNPVGLAISLLAMISSLSNSLDFQLVIC